MKLALLHWLGLWLLAIVSVQAAQNDVRFSNSLSVEDRGASGLTRLSSDEVAVIDALVRRDTLARAGMTHQGESNTAATFSQRLTADERRTAGMPKLPAGELLKLDALVDRFQNAKLARTLLAPPTYLSRHARMTPTEAKKEREIHGSFSLSYGFGSGGYSEKTGSMMLTMDDPARRYSITIGYSESHIKGGHGYGVYGDPFYYGRDPFYHDRDPFYYDRDPAPLHRLPEGAIIERR